MTFDEWLKIGMDKGWCGPSVCVTHDGVPMTEQEEESLYDDEPCIHAIRLYEDDDVRLKVEENHSPTQWRASNSGYRRQDVD
jgi:hypothetical protein